MKRIFRGFDRIRIAILAICLGVFSGQLGCVQPVIVIDIDSAETANVGDTLTYLIKPSSPVLAGTTVTLTQEFSLPVQIVSASVFPYGIPEPIPVCTHSDNKVTCLNLPLQYRTNPVVVRVDVIPLTPGKLDSIATIALDTAPNQQFSASRTTMISGGGDADLSVTTTASPNPVAVGEDLTYTIKIQNNGPFTAAGITLNDRLPSGVTFVSATPTQGTCHPSGGGFADVTCELGFAPPANAADPLCPDCITVTIVVRPAYPSTLTNTAVVTADTLDANRENNTAIVSTTVTSPSADLSVTMTDNLDPLVIGNDLTYTLTVRNSGPSRTAGFTLIDTLPANVTYVSATSSQGSCRQSAGTVSCTLADDPADPVCPDCAVVSLVIRPTSSGTITNTASVSSDQSDPNPADNSASENTTVNEPLMPDLAVTVSDSPDPVVVNQPLRYTIVVRNDGLGDAPDPVVTVTLPLTVAPDVLVDFNCSPSDQRLICTTGDLGRLPSGSQHSLILPVIPTEIGSIECIASVTASGTEPNPANNIVNEITTVNERTPTADLSLTISDSLDPVVVNEPLTYTVTVANNGLATATGIVMTFTLPPNLNFNDPNFLCADVNGSRVCRTPAPLSLTNGEVHVFTINVLPTTTGTVTFTASATGTEEDPVSGNNSGTETTLVVPPPATADLQVVSILDSSDPARVNQQFAYTVTLRNNGLAGATNVVLSITLPAGVRSDGSLECPSGGPLIQCPLGSLAAGSTRNITLLVTPMVTGTATTEASVTAQESDPDPGNNSRIETTTINSGDNADVSVSIAAAPSPVSIFHQLAFTIVVQNTGPQTATGVMLSGFNAESLEVMDIATTQGSCTQSATSIACSLGTLANGGSATITITAFPFDEGTLTKTATVTASSNDANTANNAASVNVIVNPLEELAERSPQIVRNSRRFVLSRKKEFSLGKGVSS